MRYSRSIYTTGLIALYFLSSTIGAAQSKSPFAAEEGVRATRSATSSATCPVFPSMMTLVLGDIYSDAHGSVPDEAMVQKNKEQTDKIDAFLRYAENALDSPTARTGDAASDCAYSNFKQWAKAGALTVEPKPYNRQGRVSLGEYLIGIDVLALKFKAAGFPLDRDTMQWLHTLNEKNLTFYERASNRGKPTACSLYCTTGCPIVWRSRSILIRSRTPSSTHGSGKPCLASTQPSIR